MNWTSSKHLQLFIIPIFSVFCPNVSPDKEVLVNWIYAVEFYPEMTVEQKAEAITIFELKLVSELLVCNKAALPGKRFMRNRKLFEDGVAGLNYMPLDAKNEDVACFTNSTAGGVCETYLGRMEMYLTADTDEDIAVRNMLFSIRDTMQVPSFPDVDGIIRVWYLEPDLNEPDQISTGGGSGPGGGGPGSFSTGTMVAFAALGVVVFAALVLGVLRMRKNKDDGITQFGESTYGPEVDPATVSAVFPAAYKLDGADGMNAIHEVSSESDHSRYNCSIIMSEGGFTSDGESQVEDPLFPVHFDNALGVKSEETDEDADNAMLFGDVNDFSGHRKTNLVTGSQVGLGQKHSGVDVHQCTSSSCGICNYKPADVEFVHKSPTTPLSCGNFFPDDEGNVDL